MALTNAYATPDQVKQAVRIGSTDIIDDARIEVALNAASRQIDAETGRRFWQDATVMVREYIAEDDDCLYVDDISTTTGLIVKVDADLDGTFETTLTLNTDFKLFPANASAESPARPWDEIRIRPLSAYYFPVDDDMPTVQVTAKFGWLAVPDEVTKACVVQAVYLFKSDDAAFGVVNFGDTGAAFRLNSRLHPVAAALLEPYSKARVG